MTRPRLREIPLSEALPLRPAEITVTMRERQWDQTLAEFYRAGCILLELDGAERPVRAFRRKEATA